MEAGKETKGIETPRIVDFIQGMQGHETIIVFPPEARDPNKPTEFSAYVRKLTPPKPTEHAGKEEEQKVTASLLVKPEDVQAGFSWLAQQHIEGLTGDDLFRVAEVGITLAEIELALSEAQRATVITSFVEEVARNAEKLKNPSPKS